MLQLNLNNFKTGRYQQAGNIWLKHLAVGLCYNRVNMAEVGPDVNIRVLHGLVRIDFDVPESFLVFNIRINFRCWNWA